MIHTAHDIAAMEPRRRAHFVNSLAGFKSANLIGTADGEGRPNLAVVSSVFHLGADPPLLGMISRPHTVARHTLENLLATGVYTVNHVHAGIWRAAHQTSASYGREESEFAAVGLVPEPSGCPPAPYVAESRVKLALRLVEQQTLCNGTVLVIGRIEEVRLPEGAVGADGYVDIASLETVALSGLDGYHITRPLGRLAYAKPGLPVRLLEEGGGPVQAGSVT